MLHQPTRQTAHLTIEELIDDLGEKARARAAADGIVFYAGPFGLKARKINEPPGETREQWLKGRITGGLKP